MAIVNENFVDDYEIDEDMGVIPPLYNFNQVLEVFLSLVTDFDLAEMKDKDIVREVGQKTKIATSKIRVLKDLSFNTFTLDFNRVITDFEAVIIGHAVAIEWLIPQINCIELFRPQLSSGDFTQFSNANRLQEMVKLKNDLQTDLNKMIDEYDFESVDWDDLK